MVSESVYSLITKVVLLIGFPKSLLQNCRRGFDKSPKFSKFVTINTYYMKLRLFVLCAICTLASTSLLHAEPLKLAKIFSDHMIFQQQTSAPVWGWAEPNAKVVVKPSWGSRSYSVKADNEGAWRLSVETPAYGGPYSVKIASGKERIELKDVLVGEVWVCAGQSNMEMPIEGFMRYSQPIVESVDTSLDAIHYGDKIRIFTVPKTSSDKAPLKDMASGAWQRASFESCSKCSAIAYHFAHIVNNATNIPMGVVVAAWEGTPIRPWTPRDSYEKALGELVNEGVVSKEMYDLRTAYSKSYKGRPTCAGSLYNGMIHPIKGFAARGFLWYQGCTNKKDHKFYNRLQAAMVARWRAEWGDTEAKMPFYYVLIAPFLRKDNENNFARGYFVENQASASKIIPNCHYVATEGMGAKEVIHPADKRQVSRQLALLALDRIYGVEGICSGAPEVLKYSLVNRRYTFEFAPEKGIMTPPDEPIKGFEVAGEDRVFYPTTAYFRGGCKIVVRVPAEVATPHAVRYSFREDPESNVRSRFGFPLAPFRTDNWEL